MNSRNRRYRDDSTSSALSQFPQGIPRPPSFTPQQQQAQNYARQRHTEPWNRQNFRQNRNTSWGNGHNIRQSNAHHNNGRNRTRRYQQNIHRSSDHPVDAETSQECEYAGYTQDEKTKKYYKVLPDHGAIPGFRQSDITAKRNRERLAAIASNRPRVASGSFAVRPVIQPITKMLCSTQLGIQTAVRPDVRYFESRLLNVANAPSSEHVVDIGSGLGSERAVGCQYLDVSRDGRTLFGCWAVGDALRNAERVSSQIVCLGVGVDDKVVRHSAMQADTDPVGQRPPRSYMGLTFRPKEHAYDVLDPTLVDMVTAPVDSDVTCVVYATASSRMTCYGLKPSWRIVLQPIPELCTIEGHTFMGSPIYNMYWSRQEAVWSCAWNANKMRVGLGLENSVEVVDVLADRNQIKSNTNRIPTNRKNVLSQEFEAEGNLLYLGLKAADAMCIDLRSNQVCSRLRRANHNVGFIKLLKERENCMITDNFQGQLRVWDIRRLDRELFSLPGHSNSHYRLPVFVDPAEKAVFAVGQDGTTRGWSLRSGDMLCSVPCPRPVEERTDFPRVVYSDTWGGRAGNGAIVLAVGDSIRVHELNL